MGILDFLQGRGGTRHRRTGLPQGTTVQERDEGGHLIDRRSTLGPMGWVFFAFYVIASVAVLDYGIIPLPWKDGDSIQADKIARLDFEFPDPVWTEGQRDDAEKRAPLVYRQESTWHKIALKDFRDIINIVKRVAGKRRPAQVTLSKQEWQKKEALRELRANTRLASSVLLLEQLLKDKHKDVYRLDDIARTVERELLRLSEYGILEQSEYEEVVGGQYHARWIYRYVVETKPNAAHIVKPKDTLPPDKLRTVSQAVEILRANLSYTYLGRDLQWALVRNYFPSRLKSVLIRDPEETEKEKARARAAVPDKRSFKKGDVIASRENDKRFRPAILRALRAERRAYKNSLSFGQNVKRWLGLAALVTALAWLFIVALRRVQPKALRRRRMLITHAVVCVAVLILAKTLMLNQLPSQLAPVAIAAILASLAYTQAVALITASSLSLLVGFAMGSDLALTLALMIGAVAAALPANELKHRWDLLRFGLKGGVAQGLTVLGLSFLAGTDIPHPVRLEALWGFFNCTASALLVLGALPLVETAYGIITNIRLFELSDHSQPALRKIQFEAGGTWAHSLQIGFLAVPAAEAIGANARLVQAGVCYHDLGKTLKPEYYIENNANAEDRHKRLAPSVSALIITGHVKDGIELAREFGLPRQIISFIPEHHGTTLVSYFFHTARKKAEESHDPGGAGAVQEAFFRYPGPKPQSRETAIVMLADMVEAASRTLENPSAPRLRAFVHDLIMKRLLEGQLDECDLTFRELAKIEDEFMRVLLGRFHQRIKYPGQEDEEEPGRPDKPSPRKGDSSRRSKPQKKDSGRMSDEDPDKTKLENADDEEDPDKTKLENADDEEDPDKTKADSAEDESPADAADVPEKAEHVTQPATAADETRSHASS